MAFLIIILLIVLFVTIIICKRNMQYWILEDIKRSLALKCIKLPSKNMHILFAFVDHFEPGSGGVEISQQEYRVQNFVKRYAELARRHKDSDGIYPQHTFFFPPHYDINNHLKSLVGLCKEGFGEIEMHLHHDCMEPWPDNASSLKKKILKCIKGYSRYGIFCLPEGKKKYGFIHGDWALCNSLKDGKHCGINDEISILLDTGCYADFTFPVSKENQPKLTNTIFYANSNPAFPRGYDKTAIPVKVGKRNIAGLMMIQGIIGLRWKSRTKKLLPSIEQSNIDLADFPFDARIDYWVSKHIHVEGKPEWIFIKIHTHGCREVNWEVLLGKYCDGMFDYLETKYNDGYKYTLHYVSAREMYNIIRAAEDRKEGNPNDYRDYEISRYVYLPTR